MNKDNFISFMLSCGVLRFGSFQTKSGRLSPYFVNTGLYSTGSAADTLGNFYADTLIETVGEEFDALFGPAYKGIPLCALCAAALSRSHALDRTFFYNRKEEKDHGEGGSFVGALPPEGSRVVILEDVITAGTAVRETLPPLQQKGYIVKDMLVSVDRMERGKGNKSAIQELYDDFGIRVHSIVNARDLVAFLKRRNDTENAAAMEAYLAEYCAE